MSLRIISTSFIMLTFIFFTHSVWSYAVTENKDTINHSNKTISAKSTKKNSQVSSQVSSYGEKVLIINPRKHTWAAYNSSGQLLNSGLATAGSGWCSDIKRSCRTKVGSFRIYSLGSKACVSTRYPVGRGGAPMPYCMFFNGNQGIHGSYEVVHGNISHGCVRVHVGDAAWIRFNFATIGTKVVVLSY